MDSGQEYKTLERCYPEIVTCLQLSPREIVTQLRPSGLLPNKDFEFLSNPKNENDEKAHRIIDVVMYQVKIDSQVYSTFLIALKAAGPWTQTLTQKLERTYRSFFSKNNHFSLL